MGIILIVSGVLYLGYAFLTRNRKSIYFFTVVINEGMEAEYFNLQLYVSVLNGILLIMSGLIDFQYDMPSFYFTSVPLIVHLNNFIAKLIGHRMGYLEDI